VRRKKRDWCRVFFGHVERVLRLWFCFGFALVCFPCLGVELVERLDYGVGSLATGSFAVGRCEADTNSYQILFVRN
jgi:hypothetical protein